MVGNVTLDHPLARAYWGMSDVVHSTANLSYAGQLAANVAAAAGRIQRGKALLPGHADVLDKVAGTLDHYGELFAGANYSSVSSKTMALDTLAVIAVRAHPQETAAQAKDNFLKLSKLLHALHEARSVNTADLIFVHDYFRDLAREINGMLTSSGEASAEDAFR